MLLICRKKLVSAYMSLHSLKPKKINSQEILKPKRIQKDKDPAKVPASKSKPVQCKLMSTFLKAANG